MGVRVRHHGRDVPLYETDNTDPVTVETTVDGQTFAWSPGQVRNFADDGIGVAHHAYDGDENKTQQDARPFGDSRS